MAVGKHCAGEGQECQARGGTQGVGEPENFSQRRMRNGTNEPLGQHIPKQRARRGAPTQAQDTGTGSSGVPEPGAGPRGTAVPVAGTGDVLKQEQAVQRNSLRKCWEWKYNGDNEGLHSRENRINELEDEVEELARKACGKDSDGAGTRKMKRCSRESLSTWILESHRIKDRNIQRINNQDFPEIEKL